MPARAPSDETTAASAAASPEEAIYRAELGYVTDPARQSLEHWYAQHARQVIGWSSFRRRASLGRWNERRDAFWRQVSERVVTEQVGKLAADQARELEELAAVRQRVLEQVNSLKAQPRSLEGLVGALVAVDRHVEGKRAALAERLDRVAPPPGAPELRPSPFSPDELRAMAHAVLEVRRQRLVGGADNGASGPAPAARSAWQAGTTAP